MLNSITSFNELLFTVLNLILVATSILFSCMLYIEHFFGKFTLVQHLLCHMHFISAGFWGYLLNQFFFEWLSS